MTPLVPGSMAVLLTHDLGGTAYDAGVLQKALHNASMITHVPTLPGHDMHPEDLTYMPAEAWLGTLTQAYERLAVEHDIVHITGMCMDASLALVLAHRIRHDIACPQNRPALLATPVHIDGWSTPWYRDLHYAACRISGMAVCIRAEEDEPSGIKNPLLRRIIKAKLIRGDGFHYPWVLLACIRQVDWL